MATDYFSVDRRGFYKVGAALDLFKENPLQRSFISTEGLNTPQDSVSHLQRLFPTGLSLHGWDYMTRVQDWSKTKSDTIYDCTLELLFEYVRRAAFPERPSRMQCYFAFPTIEAAQAFKADDQPIYRVHADAVLQLDQYWLTHGDQSVIASYAAHSYWSGAGSEQPNWEYMLVPPVKVLERIG